MKAMERIVMKRVFHGFPQVVHLADLVWTLKLSRAGPGYYYLGILIPPGNTKAAGLNRKLKTKS